MKNIYSSARLFFVRLIPVVLSISLIASPDLYARKASKKKKEVVQKEENKIESNQEHSDAPKIPTKKIAIRVLLEEYDASLQRPIVISSHDGFMLEGQSEDKKKKTHHRHKKLNLFVKAKSLYVQCKDKAYRRIKNNCLTIAPLLLADSVEKGVLHLNDRSYHGTITIRISDEGSLMIINKLSLDDYIYSVLRFECLAYWPLEMQNVQAIASRTYALYQMQQARNKNTKRAYDIKNTNIHQVYNGAHSSTHLRKAVEATQNMILTYKGLIALTMFDICCGGIVPAQMKRKDDDKPYLFRKNKCVYCKGKTYYAWEKTYRKDDFLDHLKANPKITKKLKKVGKVVDVTIKEKDKAGVIHSVLLKGSEKNVRLTGQEVKSSFASIVKSMAFSIRKIKNNVEIKGNGYGHTLGLCQLGARELVKQGWTYQEILEFFYPNTTLVRLKG